MTFESLFFYVVGALMLFSALRAMTTPYIFRAALYLAATLALTALQYVLLHAEFVAVVQLLVYVGAVIILVIFAVMLTHQLGEGGISQTNQYALPAAIVSVLAGWGLLRVLRGTDWSKLASAPPADAGAGAIGNIQGIGRELLGSYVLPFEIIGLLLFTALVGAVLIARKDPQ